ncbi:hypothetical protein [Lacibacter sediminis]|uniref:Uncharacterized protein n=1 Tax=Lacibacter sediminis TaxID=2760713 RepID=A0A7G5XKP3_9BACT|nr:hypothetical protein [Lacibacter sediminis]QNA46046.1 hypothetical protein H4075_07645 [Lacibacter sediminis]
MKKNILVSALMICCLYTFSQSTDSVVKQHTTDIQEIKKTTDVLKKNIDTVGKAVAQLDKKFSTTVTDCANCEIGFMQWVLIFSPVLIFMIVLLAIRKKMKDFDLKEALSETELPKKIIPNPEYTAEKIKSLAENPIAAGLLTTLLPATLEVTASDEPTKSSSRYIAFITSSLTWVLALCLTCFFIYQYIKSNEAPTLTGLSSVLLALGIGVVPYAFNKVSKALE